MRGSAHESFWEMASEGPYGGEVRRCPAARREVAHAGQRDRKKVSYEGIERGDWLHPCAFVQFRSRASVQLQSVMR